MKKLLLSIFSIFFGLISFSSACLIQEMYGDYTNLYDIGSNCVTINNSINPYIVYVDDFSPSCEFHNGGSSYQLWQIGLFMFTGLTTYCCGEEAVEMGEDYVSYSVTTNCLDFFSSSSSSPSDITVFYDYGHSSTNITCNGDNSIYINGMSSYSGYTFTPFFNISYIDQDNQNIIESYNKDILYLEDGKFKKTYTGDNQWILTVQNQGGSIPDMIFTGETLPVVVTGDSDNVFSNFSDNALAILYGNIPGFITGGVILFLIFFLIRLFIPKNRR